MRGSAGSLAVEHVLQVREGWGPEGLESALTAVGKDGCGISPDVWVAPSFSHYRVPGGIKNL
jgi:hypothetical protein